MHWIVAASILIVLMAIWYFIFNSVMKKPNNGNEFSRDDHPWINY